MIRDPHYEAWLATVPADITQDTLWQLTAYRYALYAMRLAQSDIPAFNACRETRPHIDQLLRAVAGISANLEEGYGRSGPLDRAHFFEYALSTARESRGWYYKCERALAAETVTARMSLFTQIVRMLTAAVPAIRAAKPQWRRRRDKPNADPPLDHDD